MITHSPAPWIIEGKDIVCADDSIVAQIYSPADADEQTEKANAQLIAAAPELLAAIKGLLSQINAIPSAEWEEVCGDLDFDAIHAAIEKTEGEQ